MIAVFFQTHPLVAVFLTVGAGFWLGKVKMGSFSLGAIAATLIVGVIIGQMKIVVPDMLKNVFFLLFLFATGYSVGPQFVRALKGPGLKQAAFAVVEALVCAGLIILTAKLMGYNNGIATGLYAGAQTASACLGMISDTVKELPIALKDREYLLMIIPACYAVTYVFGTVGTAWFLSSVAPSMMGGMRKVQDEVAQIETEMDKEDVLAPGQIHAGREVSFRVYRADNDFFATARTATEIEAYFLDQNIIVFVERARIGGKVSEPDAEIRISRGDNVVLGGRLEEIVDMQSRIGPEVNDPELLNFGAEKTPVTVSAKGAGGITFGALRRRKSMQRVMVASIRRNGMSIPAKARTVLYPGDVLTLVGWPRDVAKAAAGIGYADRQTNVTDMVFLGLGIAAGCILGAIAITVHGIP
ncbi:MAG: aspartate-alanine antiporter, partial [Muribaculaceae bacterium]|nr:aspartate-alanine antiporter [Muribaculaceae bacterium]